MFANHTLIDVDRFQNAKPIKDFRAGEEIYDPLLDQKVVLEKVLARRIGEQPIDMVRVARPLEFGRVTTTLDCTGNQQLLFPVDRPTGPSRIELRSALSLGTVITATDEVWLLVPQRECFAVANGYLVKLFCLETLQTTVKVMPSQVPVEYRSSVRRLPIRVVR